MENIWNFIHLLPSPNDHTLSSLTPIFTPMSENTVEGLEVMRRET